ncbi:hypothetical protein GOV10_03655 [Candidatus Woesearchaeota archaeon]|nr:hypothetical protein [Candidatus Woesearchaeota archaeon]
MTKRKNKDFRFVTVASFIVSVVLWIIGGYVSSYTGRLSSFIIIGFLATLAGAIAVNSARLEVRR